MACGHAKFTGEVGVCLATSGPGAIHLLNGLYDAKMDHQPVVAIVGQSSRQAIGRQLSAGSGSNFAFQRCGGRICPSGVASRANPASRGSRDAHRQSRTHGHVHHYSQRFAGSESDRRIRNTCITRFIRASATSKPRIHSERKRFATRGENFERRQARRDVDRRGRDARGQRSD